MPVLHKTSGIYGESYFAFAKDEKFAILYVRNLKRKGMIRFPSEIYSFDCIALKNIYNMKREENRFSISPDLRKGKGGAVFLVTSHTNKDALTPEKCFHSCHKQNNFSRHLEETELFDFSSAEVQSVKDQLINELSSEKKDNPYWQTLRALQWTNWNITYSRATIEMVRKLEKTISRCQKDTVPALLFKSFNSDELHGRTKTVMDIASQIVVPNYLESNLEKSCYILNEFDRKYPIFVGRWPEEKYLSASKTIREGIGKCDCKTHVFIALCRSMNIPAIKVSGLFRPGSLHAWAAVNVHPHGWVDIDPTNGPRIGQFNHDVHFYPLLGPQFEGKVDFLPLQMPITQKVVGACKYFYEHSRDNPSIDNFMRVLER